MEVQYDQEPFARPRYGYIVTEGRHEEQRDRIGFIPRHKGSLESQENLAIFFPDRDGQKECSQADELPVRLPTGRRRDITRPRDHFVS